MKTDIDTILYIVITLAILVISGLSSRKKKARMMEAQAKTRSEEDIYESDEQDSYSQESYEDEVPEPAPSNIFETLKSASSSFSQQSSNPFERLEQLFGAQTPIIESAEGETLENTVDEEEQILADIQRRREEVSNTKTDVAAAEEHKTDAYSTQPLEKGSRDLLTLFGNIDEIKKAVIYSEILNRKY